MLTLFGAHCLQMGSIPLPPCVVWMSSVATDADFDQSTIDIIDKGTMLLAAVIQYHTLEPATIHFFHIVRAVYASKNAPATSCHYALW